MHPSPAHSPTILLAAGECSRYSIHSSIEPSSVGQHMAPPAVASSGGVPYLLPTYSTRLHMRGGARGPKPKPKPKPSSRFVSSRLISSLFRYQLVCGLRATHQPLHDDGKAVWPASVDYPLHKSPLSDGWGGLVALGKAEAFGTRPSALHMHPYALLPGLTLAFWLVSSAE